MKWLKTHPIVSFFALALALMYLLFPAVYLMGSADQDLLQILGLYAARLAVYSPVLAGILVTRWTLPERSPASARLRWVSFGIVWLIALVVYTLDLRRSVPEHILGWAPLVIISIPIALLPAFVVSSAFSRVTSLREYLSTLVHPPGSWIWYMVALFTFPVLHLLGVAITNLRDGESPLSGVHLTSGIMSATLITFASVFFYSGGINFLAGF